MASSFNVYNSTSLAVAEAIESRSSRARASFQWGGTIFAIFLLILNRVGRKSSVQTTLLVFYLLTSFPTVLFKVLRGQFGYWIAFLAIAANLFFPETFQVSRFILLVISPDRLVDGLRNSIAGAIFCLLIGISSVIMEIREIAGNRIRECSFSLLGLLSCYILLVLLHNQLSMLRNLVEMTSTKKGHPLSSQIMHPGNYFLDQCLC